MTSFVEQNLDRGEEMHRWATDLFPIARSLTGTGVRETLAYLSELIPGLRVHSIESGSKVFDWDVPLEWEVSEAYIITPDGQKICDYSVNNLHLVGYSEPVNSVLSLEELKQHLHTQPDQPGWIPYVTSYYKKYWGFCLSHDQYMSLKEGEYKVVVKSKLYEGKLNYADLEIKGRSDKEILISSYICHPSMANNELSGPVVVTALAQWLIENQSSLNYSYRIVLVPETIGAICYLSKNLEHLRENVIAGFQISCVGDDRAYSHVASRYGNSLSDRVAREVLEEFAETEDTVVCHYDFLARGSDERQYCAPFVNLPVCGLCRSKYGEYPEYHTSADNFEVVTPKGLNGGLNYLRSCIAKLEVSQIPTINCMGEPQLGKRGLYPSISQKNTIGDIAEMMDVIAYCDGTNRVEDIATITGVSEDKVLNICLLLRENNLLTMLNI